MGEASKELGIEIEEKSRILFGNTVFKMPLEHPQVIVKQTEGRRTTTAYGGAISVWMRIKSTTEHTQDMCVPCHKMRTELCGTLKFRIPQEENIVAQNIQWNRENGKKIIQGV